MGERRRGMNDWPASLIERIKGRQAVLVAGLGCSRLAGRPGWDELARRLVEWLEPEAERAPVRALIDGGRVAAAIAILRARLADEVVVEVLRDAYGAPAKASPELALIARIPWRGVITTGFDDLWNALLFDESGQSLPHFHARDAQALDQHRGRFLLHLCGSVAAPDTVCLSSADLRRRVTPTGITDVIDALYERWSFVFLGFGLGDPDLELVCQRLLGANISSVEHFLVYTGPSGFEAEVAGAERGLTPVPSDAPLAQVVERLGEAWNSVAAEARPPQDDVEAWLEIWGRDTADDEARGVLRRAEERLRESNEWEKLVDLLLSEVERLSAPADQVPLLREVARVFDAQIDAPERAFAAALAAFRLDCDAPGLLEEVLRLAGRAGQWSDLAAEYATIVEGIARPPSRARHALELGRVYAEELNQYDAAIAIYQQVLAIEPGSEVGRAPRDQASAALIDLLAKQEKWDQLAGALLAAALHTADPAREIALRLQLGDVQATRLGDADAAMETYERVRELDPGSIKAQEALEPLYRKKERWPDLARLLEDKGKRTVDPEEAARIRAARAEVLERAGDVDASIATLEAVVSSDASNRAALRSLEKLYDKQGREQDYLRTLERLAEVTDDPRDKLLLLRRLAAEWDERPDGVDRASEALEQILQIDPHDDDAFRALGRVYRQSKRWLPFVESLNRKITLARDAPATRDLYVALGRVLEEEVQDYDGAIDAYVAATRVGDEREPTLRALARLFERRSRWREAAEALDRAAQAAATPAERAATLVQSGGIYAEGLDDRTAAEERYVRALETVPGDVATLDALGDLYRSKGEFLRATKVFLEA